MYVPSSELGLYHPLSRQRVCPSPRTKWGEGHTRLWVRGWGNPNFESLALCLLCGRYIFRLNVAWNVDSVSLFLDFLPLLLCGNSTCAKLYLPIAKVLKIRMYTVKKRFASFPSPAGMSLPNSPWAGIMTS